jgi:CheY-like chemotaxis protein
MEQGPTGLTVLVVDDREDVADSFGAMLQDKHDTRVAYTGEGALEQVDESVDVVILDRRLPDIHGDEVLDRIRERGLDCHVIMLTAVHPDFDIVDMPFDDYLTKPIVKDDLIDTFETHLTAEEYGSQLAEYIELRSKIRLLEQEKSPPELASNEEFQRLTDSADDLRAELDESIIEFEQRQETASDLL